MTIAAGARLGPYEVLAPIGAGGMGEVWKARDTRLGREVAIKVLPPELSHDRERLARFEQEARAASALNHPNIVTVHDIGQLEEMPYIAMELVEGKTLRELSASEPLPTRKLLNIAAQIADGL
ncbi:MAG: serine/threonine-protein kinase, partial [Thermoanaerobaculia bacterium]